MSVFFHSSKLLKQLLEDLNLFDIVSFKVGKSMSLKHKGKLNAHHIRHLSKGDFSIYTKRIGILYDWNGRFGFIDYPTEGKKIFLFHTRLLYSKEIQNGQLLVFNPIISKKDNSQLFAFFAYPIAFEKDIEFIKEEYQNYQIPALKDYIVSITMDNKELTLPEKFELDLIELGYVSSGQEYLKLINIIKKYKKHNYIPDHQLLTKYVSKIYLIQLWEVSQINTYDIETIKEYFITTNAETKRLVASKVTEQDREIILSNYFRFLRNCGKTERLNNEIKTLLDIVYRNHNTQIINLYQEIKSLLIDVLKPQEIIDLWLHDFMDEPSERYVVSNFDLGDSKAVKLLLQKKNEQGEAKYKELISKIYEQYFINIANKILDFETEYPKLINYLQIFENEFKDRYSEIIDIIKVTLNSHQKFVLWILGVKIDLDVLPYVQQNYKDINHYFRLKFILRSWKEGENFDLQYFFDLLEINQEGLSEFAQEYKWNKAIYPIKVEGKECEEYLNHFINDIDEFNERCKQKTDRLSLANTIFQSVEKYNEIHLRLWIYVFNDKTHYDYVGFRESFKSLTSE
jgi:hypothetical protein